MMENTRSAKLLVDVWPAVAGVVAILSGVASLTSQLGGSRLLSLVLCLLTFGGLTLIWVFASRILRRKIAWFKPIRAELYERGYDAQRDWPKALADDRYRVPVTVRAESSPKKLVSTVVTFEVRQGMATATREDGTIIGIFPIN